MSEAPNRYFIVNKPYNMVSQFISSHNVNLLGAIDFDFPEGIHAIGRLDNLSEGLLIPVIRAQQKLRPAIGADDGRLQPGDVDRVRPARHPVEFLEPYRDGGTFGADFERQLADDAEAQIFEDRQDIAERDRLCGLERLEDKMPRPACPGRIGRKRKHDALTRDHPIDRANILQGGQAVGALGIACGKGVAIAPDQPAIVATDCVTTDGFLKHIAPGPRRRRDGRFDRGDVDMRQRAAVVADDEVQPGKNRFVELG